MNRTGLMPRGGIAGQWGSQAMPGPRWVYRLRYMPRPGFPLIWVALVTAGALVARLWYLSAAPNTLNTDELVALRLVARILSGHGPGLVALDGNGQPAVYAYLQALSMRLCGPTVWALRLPAALCGALAVPLFYAVARQVARPWPALGATVLFGSSVYALSLARSGWVNDFAYPAWLVALWALSASLRGDRLSRRLLGLSALACAAAGYGYAPFRLLPLGVLPLLLIGARARQGRTDRWSRYALAALWLGVYALASLPLWAGLLAQHDILAHYIAAHRINSQLQEYPPGTPLPSILTQQFWRVAAGLVLLVPSTVSGLDLAHVPAGTWLLDPIGTLLYWLGLWALVAPHDRAGKGKTSPLGGIGGWWWLLVVPLLAAEVPVRDSPGLHPAAAAFPLYFLVVAQGLSYATGRLRRLRVLLIPVVLVSTIGSLGTYAAWVNSPAAASARHLVGVPPCVPTISILRQPCRDELARGRP